MNLVSNLATWFKEKYTEIKNDIALRNKQIAYKIIILGEEGVGKSSFCNRYFNNQFNLEIKPSLNENKDFQCHKSLFEDDLIINVIDVSNNILSFEHSKLYFDAQGAIILYDVTNRKSFDKVDSWIMDLRQTIGRKAPIMIVGNKVDLNFLKSVHLEELKEKAAYLNCDYGEISCINEDDVDKVVDFLICKVYYLNLPENKQNSFLQFFK